MKESIIHRQIQQHILNFIKHLKRLAALYIRIRLMQRAGHRPEEIPCYGTTHADYIYGEVPCLRCLTEQEIEDAYEKNTGLLIVSEFQKMKKDVLAVPAVLCKNHGPFSWGKDGMEAVHNAVVLEECAKMAFRTELIQPKVKPAPQALQDKHYYRKHGANAYYGQTK